MHFIPTERLLISDLLSSPEPLSASGWRQHLLRRRWEAEDGPCGLHCEDEVSVCSHHGKTRQEGEAETKPTDAAAKSCGHPVNQPGDTKQTHLFKGLNWPGDMKQTLLYKSLNRPCVAKQTHCLQCLKRPGDTKQTFLYKSLNQPCVTKQTHLSKGLKQPGDTKQTHLFKRRQNVKTFLFDLIKGLFKSHRPKAKTTVSRGTSFSCSWLRYIAMTTSCRK